MVEITETPSSEIKTVTPEQVEPLGDRMTDRVNRFFATSKAGLKEFGAESLHNLRSAAKGAKRLSQAGILVGGMTLVAACGGETGPLPKIATATPTEIRPSTTATVEPTASPTAEPPTEQAPEPQAETEAMPKIEVTGRVIPADETYKRVFFYVPETVTKGENPLIPEGETGVYVFQLGKDVGVTSIVASDILGLPQVGKFRGVNMGVPGQGQSHFESGKDILTTLEGIWETQSEDFPKLDDEAREVINNIQIKLLRLNNGELQIAIFRINEPYTYTTQQGEFTVTPDDISFRFEQDGNNPITGDGSIHVPNMSRAAEIGEFSIDSTPDTPIPEPSTSSGVKVTVIGTVTPTPAAQEPTPTPESAAIPTTIPTEQPAAEEDQDKIVEEDIREQNEMLEKMPTLTTTPIEGSSLGYKLNDDGSFTIENSGYDYTYSFKLKEETLNEGPNTLALDLQSFAGMTIHPEPELASVANLAIEIPENPDEISKLNQTINVGNVLADVGEHIPVADLNRDQERFAAQAAQFGFGQAIDNYVQNIQNLYGLNNPDDAKAMLRTASQETLAHEAPYMIAKIRDRIAGGATIPDDIQQEFTSLQSSIIQTIETRGMDAGIEEIKREVGRIYSVIQRKYGAYVSLPSHESVMDTVNQELSGVFLEIVPDFAAPSQTQIPEHLAEGQIIIKDGSIHIPVGGDGIVSLAVDEPEEFSGEMDIKGNVNGENEFSLRTIRTGVIR